MVARTLTGSPERTAWTVILGAFCTFVLLVSTLVVGGRWWLQNASVEQGISLEPTGNVLVTRTGRSAPEVNLAIVPAGSQISTENTAQASLTFVSSDGKQVLATVKVFGGSVLQVSQADSPRYPTGIAPHRIRLRLTSGRVRATVGVDVTRQVQIIIESEPGATTIMDQPGSNVSVQVDTSLTSMVTVRDGQATVSAHGTDVVLVKDKRAQVAPNSAPTGPLAAEQNLVKDGDFTQPLEGSWLEDPRPPADPAEETGTAKLTTVNGRRTVHIIRTGANWGHAGITQVINRDVQGLTSLRLNMDIQIDSQDVLNCGQLGTECPLMVKVSYVDVGGGAHEWLQGFYWFNDPNPAHGLTYCASCFPVQYKHILWPLGAWKTYTSDDLLQIFASSGAQAATIKSITIYGEGHSFESYFTDVQLLANE